MNDIEVGHVLCFKIRFNNNGDVSKVKHPYVVIKVDDENKILEIVQIDSIKPKNVFRLAYYNSKTSKLFPTLIIPSDNPEEKVLDKDSFAQLDNKFVVENFDSIQKFRRQKDKLSRVKLKNLIEKYREYHKKNVIDENKQVYMSEEEFKNLNQ